MAVSLSDLYEQLPTNTVRTIILSPGSRTDPLRCRFKLQKIPQLEKNDCSLPYEALSYTWGAAVFPQRIACQSLTSSSSLPAVMTMLKTFRTEKQLKSTETTVSITQNLYDALVHLRQRWKSRELWVDSICINQEDTTEKASQIPLMGRVYFFAKRVIIWLGLPDEHTTQALALLNMIAKTAKLETSLRRPMLGHFKTEDFDEERNADRGFPSWITELEKWQALCPFISRPWFSRVWVLQEAILARKALVQVGDNLIDWADFCTAVTYLVYKYPYASRPPVKSNLFECLDGLVLPCSFSRCVWPAIWNDPTTPPMDLATLLAMTHNYQAAVPRDKVYAFLGLANEYDVLVDYEVELRDVYIDVARHLLSKSDAESRSFCLASVHHDLDIDVKFPSWVPKWHVQSYCISMKEGDGERYSKFEAGGEDGMDILRHPSSPSVLELTGFVLGVVEISHKIQDRNEYSDVWDLLVFARSLLVDPAPYRTGDPIDEVIVSTIIEFDNNLEAPNFRDLIADAYEHKLGDLTSESKFDEAAAMREEWQAEASNSEINLQRPELDRKILTRYKTTLSERSFFCSQEGYIGLGPYILQPGDLVCVLFGFNIPCVLRPVNKEFLFVGECYVHGVMYGEALKEGRREKREFKIL